MFDKYKLIINGVLHVSKLTNVGNKKLIIFIGVLFSNLVVFFDIAIIVLIANIFSEKTDSNLIIDYFSNEKYFLPIFVFLRFSLIYFEKLAIFKLQQQVGENIRLYLLEEVYKKGNYSISQASYLTLRLSEHVSFFYSALTSMLSSFIQLLVYILYLSFTEFELIVYFFVFSTLLVYPTAWLLKKGRLHMRNSYLFGQEFNKDLQGIIDNLFLIKILKTQKTEFDRFKQNSFKYKESQNNNFKYGTINSILPNFLLLFVVSILITFTTLATRMSLEFLGITIRLVQTLSLLNSNLNKLVNSHVHLVELENLENNKTIYDSTESSIDKDLEYALDIEGLSFKYFDSEKYIFSNLSLQIKKNIHTIIKGSNGSGKSTLVCLMSGVLVPNKGKIYLSSNRLAYVSSSPLIIKGSLRENLLYGNVNIINDSKLIELVKEFKLFQDSSIDLEKLVDNSSLSSGQMQKISFIRAILLDSDILFLDESTSNLDDSSKMLISEILDQLNLTIINCTHEPDLFNYDDLIDVNKLN